METEVTARSASIEILNDFSKNHRLDYSTADDLESRDRARVREYVQGIMRRLSYLDFLIAQYSNVSFEHMNERLKNILRLGIYEMLFMDGTPLYASINEGVEIAKVTLGHKTGELVNAIFRNLQRDLGNLPQPKFEDRSKLIATTFSHPQWLVERWVKKLGERQAFKLMQANNLRPEYYIRVNSLRTKPEYFSIRMEKNDVDFEKSEWLDDYFKIPQIGDIISKGWVQKGFCQIQDIAAGFAPTILQPQPGEQVYDLCAAPGTKAIMIADRMKNEGSVLAVDIDGDKLYKLSESAMSFEAEIIKVRRADATQLDLPETDAVILDAPCTGTGVLSKRADLRWRRTPEDLEQSVQTQKNLLNAAARMVKKGGRLVYSTCSLETEENIGQVKNFLKEHPEFKIQSLDGLLPDEVLNKEKTYYQTYPHRHHCDGHFGVLMVRKE